MATKNTTVTKQYMADIYGGSANPGDLHIPIGRWDPGTGLSWTTRALLYAPISFSGMTAINEARLYLRAHVPASGWHAKGTLTSTLQARRKTSDWAETSGGTSAAVDESWGGNGDAYVESGYAAQEAGDLGNIPSMTNGSWYYITITEIVQDWFNGSANYGVMIYNASSETDNDYAKEFYSRHASGSQPYIWIDYSTNTAPDAPVNLSPSGSEVVNSGSSVYLSGRHTDADGNNTGRSWQINVYEDDGTTLVTSRSYNHPTDFSTFGGSFALNGANKYFKWMARTKDNAGAWGPYSALQRFKANSVPNTPTLALLESPTTDVKTLTPTFKVTHSDPDAGDTKAYKYQIVLETSGGSAVWDSGEVTLGTPIATVSKLYNGPALDWGTEYRWKARTQDSNGAWSSYSAWASLTTHETGTPTSLSPSGITIGGISPTFSGSRASSADSLSSAQVQVYSSDGVTLIWDSGTFTGGVSASAFTKAYGGTALSFATQYKWRARVTSSVGGTSDWSSLKTFTTPAASDILTTAPIGPGITDLTPDFSFSRTNAFNAAQVIVYESDGTTVHWDSGVVGISSTTSATWTLPGGYALEYATEYLWKVRVSSDGGSTWGGGYTDPVSFTTDEAGLAVPVAPSAGARLGAPIHVLNGDSIAAVTNGASTSASVDTADYQEGVGSLALAITGLNGASHTYETVALDLSDYGDTTPIKAWIKCSTLTNITTIRLRFTDSLGAYAEYDVKPAGTSWTEKSAVKGTPTATSGTIDWSDITRIGLAISTSAAVTATIRLDDVRLDATAPSFDFGTSDSDTLTYGRVRVYSSDQTTLVWDSGDVAGSGSDFAIAYGGAALTTGQTYYWQGRYTKSTGPVGAYSALQPFRLNAPPSAPTGRTPATGEAYSDSLDIEFSATFEDADLPLGDLPSGFEVEVRRNSDDVLMHRLITRDGLVAGANTLQRTTEGTGLTYEVEYKWRARFADSMGEWSAWSSYNVVKPSEPPTVTITSPTGTISSPAITVTWSFSSAGGKGQQRYKVRIIRDSDEVDVYDTGYVSSSVTSHSVPGGYLVNNTAYTIWVQAVDTDDLFSGADTESITSDWAAPDAIEGLSLTVVEDESKMLLSWSATSLSEAEFSYYAIYRRKLGDTAWTLYDRITSLTTSEYSDYFAGHGVSYEYKVTVWKVVVGDVDVESPDSEIPYGMLDPDAWYIVGSDLDPSHIFELPVYDESHSEPIQQEVFEPLGSRRKSVVRGKVLGAEGSLEVRWMSSERQTAQEQLRFLSDTAGPHILKSPFGDVWQVSFSGPAKKYTGGGHLSATLAWIEVV